MPLPPQQKLQQRSTFRFPPFLKRTLVSKLSEVRYGRELVLFPPDANQDTGETQEVRNVVTRRTRSSCPAVAPTP